MGKQKKKNKNQYREDYYDTKPMFRSDGEFKNAPKRYNDDRPQRQTKEVEYSPVALLIRDELVSQIQVFTDRLAAGESVGDAASELLLLAGYPCNLQGCEGAENYQAYQLERNVYPSKKDPNILFSPSSIILVTDKKTMQPAFLVKAFMNYNAQDKAYRSHIVIYEQGDKGTIYGKTLRWSSDR